MDNIAASKPVPPADAYVSRLRSTTFPHPHARSVIDDVVSAMTRPGGPTIVAVIGPSGVGKSKMLEIVDNALAHHWRADLEASPRPKPVTHMDAPAAMHRDYPLGTFFKEALRSLADPELERLVGLDQLVTPTDQTRIRPARVNWEDLRDMAARRFIKRSVRVLQVDEANHLARHRHPDDLRATLDVVKSFVRAANIRIVLYGAPGLRDFERASAQLGRRIIPFEFHRYRWAVERERKAFRAVARAMLECIDGLAERLIEESLDQCFERSLGCVGTLYDWLVQAEYEFVTSGRPWSVCLSHPAPSTEKALASLDEIERFELRTQPTTRATLRARLGLTTVSGPTKPTAPATGDTAAAKAPRVGRRAPVRDAHGSQVA